MRKKYRLLSMLLALLSVIIVGCSSVEVSIQPQPVQASNTLQIYNIPEFSSEPYVVINDNEPEFDESQMTTTSFESYSDLDELGRCGVAFASVGTDTMPTEERKSIGHIKPTGWRSVKYDFVDGKSLYNRCHLIGFQLTGENANDKNLITGTRYMNVDGMLPFENMVADYVKETNNHVMYRVTPIFEGDNLVANGVQMEAKSVEDNGESICFNVFCYNVQPGVDINYANGESAQADISDLKKETSEKQEYILNVNSKKFHYPTCSGASKISKSNSQKYSGDRQKLIDDGYEPCGICKP